MLVILAFLSATVLAFRFNVLILVPAILVGWILALVGGSTARQLAFVTLSLQLGYLAGILLQWALLAGHSRPHRTVFDGA